MRRFFIVGLSLFILTPSVVADTFEHKTGKNQFSKVHLSVGYGPSFSSATDDILNAFHASGFSGIGGFLTKVVFPYHSSKNWSWNYEASYRLARHWQASIGMRLTPDEKIVGFGGLNLVERGAVEFAEGETYYLTVDYLIHPIHKKLWTRWEVSTGVGLSYSSFKIYGDLGSYFQAPNVIESEPWELNKNVIGGLIRTNLDCYLAQTISLQLRVSGYFIPSIDVPRQTFDIRVLEAHSIRFSTVEVSLRTVLHF